MSKPNLSTAEMLRLLDMVDIPGISRIEVYEMISLLVRWHRELERGDSDDARMLRAIIASQDKSNHWRWMVEQVRDFQLADELIKITVQAERDTNTRPMGIARFKPTASPFSHILDGLADKFFFYNPLFEELATGYAILHGNNNSNTVGELNYITKSENTFRMARSHCRKQQKESNERLRAYDPHNQRFVQLGKRAMRSRLPPLDTEGREYYQTEMCRRFRHQLSPLYRFHAQAWGLRMYAGALESAGFERCPFLGHQPTLLLSVEKMREYNDIGDPTYCRWMIEADRFLEQRRIDSLSRGRRLSPKSHALYLTMFYDIILPGTQRHIVLCASPLQELPNKVINLMPSETEQRTARKMNRMHKYKIAGACSIEDVEMLLEMEKKEYWNDRPLPKLTRRSGVVATSPHFINDPNSQIPDDFVSIATVNERAAQMLDALDDIEDEPSNHETLDDLAELEDAFPPNPEADDTQ